MAYDARCRLRIGVLGWVFAAVLTACSSIEPIEVAPNACVQGQSLPCACASAAPSIKVCMASGAFATCQCGSLSGSGSGGDGMPGGEGGAGGQPTGGIGGRSGEGGTGIGGAGMPGGIGGAGEGGASGEGGSSGDGGSSGNGGRSGDGGSSGDGSGGAGGGEPRPAAPGTLYGPCVSNACNAELVCVNSNTRDGASSYCTSTCGQGLGQCEDPSTGTVKPACVFSFCLLQACQDHECPLGMSCVQTEVSFPGGTRTVAQCVYP